MSQSSDAMIPKNESGHPIQHVLTTSVPTSQCMTCHMHPGTNMVATYQGLTWWDNETDGDKMYPVTQPIAVGDASASRSRNAIPKAARCAGCGPIPTFLHKTGIA